MAYDEKLAGRIRQALQDHPSVEEKKMMGGLTFMVNGKMCVGIFKNELMCRINPDKRDEALERSGCHEMDFTGKPMKGFVLVSSEGMKSQKDFDYWINLSLDYNKIAKASHRKSTKK